MKTIKSIINEEIALLTESRILSDDNLVFKQTIVDSDFFNYDKSSDYDYYINESNITVNWNVKLWLNNFGIENFVVEIDNIEGQYILEQNDKQSDELVNNTAKNINDIKWNFEISNFVLNAGGSLYIRSLEFDFKNNTCKVKF